MFNPLTVIAAFCLYMVILFGIAYWVERRSRRGKRPADNPVIYSLSMAVYCTSWTFYGSVGKAASTQMLYLSFNIGTTLALILGWTVLRKLIRIKVAHRITSIADFVSLRYSRSQGLAAMVTVLTVCGIAPYIALQLKAVTITFDIIADSPQSTWIGRNVGPIVALLMILFTNVFGVRRLDPTERHPGMMVAVAMESIVKLAACLAAGVFVTYFIYDGMGDIFERMADPGFMERHGLQWDGSTYMQWTTYIVLAMSAVLFLPRQFHVAVVENYDEGHIKTAMWLFPLYMLLISLFVLPVAMGGLFMGFPQKVADGFVLSIPFHYNQQWLSLFIFIGGFSAATSMIMVSAMAISTMVTNHLFLPLFEWFTPLGFLRRKLLACRWAAVAGIILLGYHFQQAFAGSYMLVNMGVISFAAVLQVAPAILGGMFWRQGNRTGAYAGLLAGAFIWAYTLVLPAFAKSGWIEPGLVETGPWNISWLRPEQLMGLNPLDPVSHSVFWSLVFNIGLYVAGSLFFRQRSTELRSARDFVDILSHRRAMQRADRRQAGISLHSKKRIVAEVLDRYFSKNQAAAMMQRALTRLGLTRNAHVTIDELAEFYAEIEKALSGTIGAATAHMTMKRTKLFTATEHCELSDRYAEILADLKVRPEELKEKVDYYQERETILTRHARELETTVAEREREIDQRKRIENALKKSEHRYRSLLEAAPDPIVVYAVDGQVTYLNRAFTRVFGWALDDWNGNGLDTHVPEDQQPATRNMLQATRRDGSVTGFETRRCTRDGRLIDVSISASMVEDLDGQPIGMVVIISDISARVRTESEREKLERMLNQAQKMEAIGTLAGGIAHDFNNILSAIIGFTELSQMKAGDDSGIQDYLNKIHKAGNRARDLVQQILTFSRQTEQEMKPVQAGIIVKEVLKLLRASLPTTIDIHQEIRSRALVIGDPTQIHQILMNLCTNAGHAMRRSGGRLTVTLADMESSDLDPTDYPELALGQYVRITVADTGEGIARDNLSRIFDPFFTTKKIGEGTGMGLAVVHGIVKSHGGSIRVTSQPGQGTAFTIMLPAMEQHPLGGVQAVRKLPTGNERILLVDDEPVLVEIGTRQLESLGYTVAGATGSVDALARFMRDPGAFDLVITDMTMPQMAGDQLARRIFAVRPDIPIILCTGFSMRMTEKKALAMGIRAFIMKPLVAAHLAETVRRVLDDANASHTAADGMRM